MEEDTAWKSDVLPELQVPHQGFAWPDNGVDPFDLHHVQTATLYWAHGKPSRAFVTETPEGQSEKLYDAIPMGYTTLLELEKLALVADGRELRVWPHSQRSFTPGNLQLYQFILPPIEREYLKLGASRPFRFAMREAVALSARTGGPIVVCRVLSNISWY